MAKKEFIPIPLPAEIPEPEDLDLQELKRSYLSGEIDLICVMGPTASGKTSYAVNLAKAFGNAEIISADSRQVYAGMDIGTGKDIAEYGDVPYHLIDIVPAGSKYNIYQYQRDFSRVYEDCRSRGVIPIMCGGSGLYIEAATRPEYKLGENANMNLVLPEHTFYIALTVDRDTRRERIRKRLKDRLDNGMLIEVKNLLSAGIPPEDLIYYGLEYKYLTLYLTGKMDVEHMYFKLLTAIFQFAKRQMTWLRGMERDGIRIHWVKPQN